MRQAIWSTTTLPSRFPPQVDKCMYRVRVTHDIFLKISHVRPKPFPNVSFSKPRRLVCPRACQLLQVKCSSPRRANLLLSSTSDGCAQHETSRRFLPYCSTYLPYLPRICTVLCCPALPWMSYLTKSILNLSSILETRIDGRQRFSSHFPAISSEGKEDEVALNPS